MNPDSPVKPRIPAVHPDKADIEVRQYSTTEELLRRAGSLNDTNSNNVLFELITMCFDICI